MEKHIVIITATYNHCKNLPCLYESLCNMSNQSFRWILVNDGSTDDTHTVIGHFQEENKLEINYIHKTNSGKSSSLNKAFELVRSDELAVIIDDDEQLDTDAVDKLYRYYEEYYQSEYGIFHFLRRNRLDMKPIANYDVVEDLKMDYRHFKASGHNADGYIAYFGYILSQFRFPIFQNEKYIGPAVLMMLAGEKYKMIWSKEELGATEYLEGGITKQGRKLRVKNPIGGLYYCCLCPCNFKTLVKFSIMGYAYQYISGKSTRELLELEVPMTMLSIFFKLPGILLGIYWKKKVL